jgi:uncharacterized Fe-S cluster-containing protein
MQKFDFDKVELIMKAGKLKRELSPGLDIASLYVAGYEDAVQACSEHYEEQIRELEKIKKCKFTECEHLESNYKLGKKRLKRQGNLNKKETSNAETD